MLHISLTTKLQIKLLLHVLCQILGDICRGIQTSSVTSYHKHINVVAVTFELHKIISFPSQSLDITLLTQRMQPLTLCQFKLQTNHMNFYIWIQRTGKGLLIPKLEFDQLVRKGKRRFYVALRVKTQGHPTTASSKIW